MSRALTGKRAEDEACKYLLNCGCEIVERNHRTRWAEIDIIAKKKNLFLFVEVRSRTGETYGLPEESLNHKKINRLTRAALIYLSRNKNVYQYRIDAVCVVFDDTGVLQRLDCYEDITS